VNPHKAAWGLDNETWTMAIPMSATTSENTRLRRGCGDESLYASLAQAATGFASRPLEERLSLICDMLWDALAPRGLSWVGFYAIDAQVPVRRETRDGAMILVARRDKPACSPIGLQGVCGQSFLEESSRLVEDVALLGANYIACDPRDRSEVVVPIYRNGECWGVLDADSHEIACFGDADVRGLGAVLRAAGLLPVEPQLRADRLQEPTGSV
jgi:putative methionine-R-sulfoxide reductase with GAF domain